MEGRGELRIRERWVNQLPSSKQTQQKHTTPIMYALVFMQVCVRATQSSGRQRALRDYGIWDLQNPDPIRPRSAQKCLRTVTLDWQTGAEGQFTRDEQMCSGERLADKLDDFRPVVVSWWNCGTHFQHITATVHILMKKVHILLG